MSDLAFYLCLFGVLAAIVIGLGWLQRRAVHATFDGQGRERLP